MKYLKAILILLPIALLTACAGGGTSTPSESAFVSGDGVAIYVQPADRKLAPSLNGAKAN